MKLLFKTSELELGQIGFKGTSTSKTAIEVKEEGKKTFEKIEKEKRRTNANKAPTKTQAFMENHKEVHQKINNNSVNLQEILHYQKVLVALNYQFILCKTLKYSLHKLGKRGGISDYYLRDFIEKFIPIAFFRVPIFREQFLKLLVETFNKEDKDLFSNDSAMNAKGNGENSTSGKETTGEFSDVMPELIKGGSTNFKLRKINPDNEIDEWFKIEFPRKDNYESMNHRNSNYEDMKKVEECSSSTDTEQSQEHLSLMPAPILSPLPSLKTYEGAIAHIFDWEHYFYSHLPDGNEQKKESDRILKSCIQSTKWHDRIKKRGVGFLLIVTEWAKYVKLSVVRRNVFWQDVPGYKTIVKAVLREMQNRSLLLYPDALIDATMALLANEKVNYNFG
jgi:hypothetical protein